ncbi:Cytochrome P450 CYP302 [Frankliniella occidentalis]|uniref:Cytochrome P450 302a1, mitochondrial-like n=1 Tax=Frankliniella occidentalis TaxID=133901 RepID=A0A9C6TZW4_FRAOC|nr:cytochrome P450 302a1, mitochondrial-like [Frankliniella occidentalis]XP_052123506.1 cytochrome P450 302a1, mitochondrial-like [Frankliniella occidentalis]KAE8746854.1 Cytochrome P450 CYP302 [Frankliniella occidentalis]
MAVLLFSKYCSIIRPQTYFLKLLPPVKSNINRISLRQQIHTQNVRPFDDIPGPKSGDPAYNHERLDKAGLEKYLKYGPIVREEVSPGNNILLIFDTSDIEQLSLSENSYPSRRSHLAVEKFRKSRPTIYNSGGLLSTNGEEWWKLRRDFQKGFSAPQAVRAYLPAVDEVIQEFVTAQLCQPCEDFLPLLSRLSLQLTCLVAFDEKFDCFSPEEKRSDSRSSRLMEAASTINSLGFVYDNVESLRLSIWPKLEDASLFMEEVAVEFVQRKAESLANSRQPAENSGCVPSLFERYLTSPNFDCKDVNGMAVDLLLAGIETTAYTASFALYHLARNSDAQKKLQLEAQTLLQSATQPISGDILSEASYARAVLKEVFRMSPISIGVGRLLNKDLVLSGYQIPKGTNVVTQNQVACRLEKYFDRPNDFLPERWLKESPRQEKVNPFLVLPFGHGRRSCIARRLAEQQLLTFLLRVARTHCVTWNSSEPLGCISVPINKPDQPVKLVFSRL